MPNTHEGLKRVSEGRFNFTNSSFIFKLETAPEFTNESGVPLYILDVCPLPYGIAFFTRKHAFFRKEFHEAVAHVKERGMMALWLEEHYQKISVKLNRSMLRAVR